MSALKDRLRADLTASMKARDELTTATLRMVLTAVQTEEVAGQRARELSDEEVSAVLRREVKKRREAATAFADAGRRESAEREQAESGVLEIYLPAQMSQEELSEVVRVAVQRSGGGPRALGGVIKDAQAVAAGRAEGGRIAAEARRQLSDG